MRTLLKSIGSLWFAIALIGLLVVVLVTSTLLESAYGTPFVQRFFYQAGWFDVFLSLFFLNILCSALSRWPYKKQHTGFVITHTGILILLVGSLMTRLMGVEGQMGLTEGEAQDKIQLQDYQLVIHEPQHETRTYDLSFSFSNKRTLPVSDPHLGVILHKAAQGLEERSNIVDGGPESPRNPAVKFTLKSEMAGIEDSMWLIENHPRDPHASQLSMGMASFELKKRETMPDPKISQNIKVPTLHISLKDLGKDYSVAVPETLGKDLPLGDSGLVLSKLEYFPDARVGENNKLVSVSEQPGNPAAEFEVRDAKGQKEFHTKFALFPDFDSLHGRDRKSLFGLSVELLMPLSEEGSNPKGASLTFYHEAGKPWTYMSKFKGGRQEGVLEKGKTLPAGWMDFSFRVDEILDRAKVESQISPVPGAAKGNAGAEISVALDGKEITRDWVLPDRPLKVNTSHGDVLVTLGVKTAPVPFRLALRDFRKVDYPGTANAASYESDVTLEDGAEGVMIKKTIKMNEPLDYKGYRIFQSSFVQDSGFGEMSIFTIAKNPGISLIYGGSIVMFLGVILVFYIRPFSSLQIGGSHARRKNSA